MKILALDLSLTATGYARSNGDVVDDESGVLEPPKKYAGGLQRLRWIRDQVRDLATGFELAAIEGYAFGRINQAHYLGELGGIIRLMLFEEICPIADIPPACLKLFATGKGNAPKDEVLAAAIRKLHYAGHDHNEADALWLLQMAQCQVGVLRGHTEQQRKALAKINWPDLPAKAA